LVYVGLAAIAVSTIWTTNPLAPHGSKEKFTLLLLGVALLAAAAIGRSRFAATTPAKLLCALGVATCMRLAVDPTFESIGSLADTLPMWILDAYPGLGTLGWIVLGIGGSVWCVGGGKSGTDNLFRKAGLISAIALIVVAFSVRAALTAAGYEVPAYSSGLTIYRIIAVAVPLLVIMTVSGERKFAHWPSLIVGLALIGHVARMFMGGGGEA
ncbi:MAG TPA: hypothetical protein QGH10_16710, partial [Armatimonadota bacterium]|nr:hypothetical protein [Armatimonadota bacterium]